MRERFPDLRPKALANMDNVFEMFHISGSNGRPPVVTESLCNASIKPAVSYVDAMDIEEKDTRWQRCSPPESLKDHQLESLELARAEVRALLLWGHEAGEDPCVHVLACMPKFKSLNPPTCRYVGKK